MRHVIHHCDDTECLICTHDLTSCEVCKGVGKFLPSECPGEPLTEEQETKILNHVLDFKNGFWFNPKYRGYVGAWEVVSPGMQFKTTAQRVLGAIWFKSREEIWCAQRYIDGATVHYFRLQRDAELYVKAVDEESRLIALEACHAS